MHYRYSIKYKKKTSCRRQQLSICTSAGVFKEAYLKSFYGAGSISYSYLILNVKKELSLDP